MVLIPLGNVMCGNPVAALRNRTKKTPSKMSVCKAVTQRLKEVSENNNKVNRTISPEESLTNREDIFEELRQWRLQNER